MALYWEALVLEKLKQNKGITAIVIIVILIIFGFVYHNYQKNNINGSYYFLGRESYDAANDDIKKNSYPNTDLKKGYPNVQIRSNKKWISQGSQEDLTVNKQSHTLVKNGESASYVYDNATGKLLIIFNDDDDSSMRTTLILAKKGKSLAKKAKKAWEPYGQAY